MNLAICDDNPNQSKMAHSLVQKMPEFSHFTIIDFDSPGKLLGEFEHYRFEIVIADISFGDNQMDGIELAAKLSRMMPDCQIIFLTSYLSYATRAYDVEHAYLVYKLEMEERLPLALKKALDRLLIRKKRFLRISQRNATLQLLIAEISYVERIQHVSYIYCGKEVIPVSDKLHDLYIKLSPSYFTHCHQSYLVNLEYVRTFRRTEFILRDQTVIPISRSLYLRVKQDFTRFEGEMG